MPFARRHWIKLVAIIAMTMGAAASSILQPWPMKILVDYALGGVTAPQWLRSALAALSLDPSAGSMIILAGALTLVLFLLNSAFDIGLSWTWMATGQRMVYDLAAALLNRLIRLSLLFHSRGSVGDYLDRLTNDTWCVYTLANLLLVSPIIRVITLLGIGAVAWQLSPQLTLLSFSVAPVLAASVWYFGPRLKGRAKRSREAQSHLTRFVHQTVTSMPLVQAFGTELRNQGHYGELVDNVVTVAQRGVLINESYALVNGLANSSGRAVVLFAGSLQVLAGDLTVGSLLVFLAYVGQLQGTMSGLLQTYAKLKTAEASLDRLFEVLDSEETIDEVPDAQPLPAATRTGGVHIEFDRVTFGYDSNRSVLSEICFEAYPGEKIAIVGPTGAGKSTLVSLIPRLFDPTEGRVLFDGQNIRETTLDSLRKRIAIVLQEPFLLPLTVAENIAYGYADATREQIVAAAEAASAHEFISQLTMGYDTVIGERGSTLSGGQKQRIAIARALIRNTSVIILDEPTSALDAETEASLLDALEQLTQGRTTFVIAHRLSTIRKLDRILVLDEGRIVESGTHDQLLARNQLYQHLHQSQFGAVTEEVST